jgi:hypothetical protein
MYRITMRTCSPMLAVVLAIAALPVVAATTAHRIGVTTVSIPGAAQAAQSADDTPWPIAAPKR